MSRWRCWLTLATLAAGASSHEGHTQVPAEGSSARAPQFLFASTTMTVPLDVSKTPVLRRRISVNLDGVTLDDALSAIARRSNLRLVYSRDVVPLGERVHLKAEDITVAAALTAVLLDANVDIVLSSDTQGAVVKRQPASNRSRVGVVRGTVTDARTHAPLADVAVALDGSGLGALSGADGQYRILNVPAGMYTLSARRIGYTKVVQSITVADSGTVTWDLVLEPAASTLDEVVITGTIVPTKVKALPTPITVLSDSLILLQQPRTVAELFRQNVPGAVSWDLPNEPYLTAFSTRGSTTLLTQTGQMKIFIDGVPVSNPNAAPLDPASIERVEVIRGPEAAAIYGSDAIGGVVQFFTKRGEANSRPQVDLQVAQGIVQTPYADLSAGRGHVLRQSYTGSVHGGSPNATYNAGGSYARTGDYISNDISETSNLDGYVGTHYSQGIMGVDLSGRASIHGTPGVLNPLLGATGFSYASKPYYQINEFRFQSAGANIAVTPTNWWQNVLTLGVDRFTTDARQARPRFTFPGDSLLSVYMSTSTKSSIAFHTILQGALAGGVSGSVTAGIDYYETPMETWSSSNTQQNKGPISGTITASRDRIANSGVFTQVQLGLHDALFLTAGLRGERNTAFGDSIGTVLAPRVGLSYAWEMGAADLKLRTSWGRAIRAPSPQYKRASVATTQITLANLTLGPERQSGWDGGVDIVFGTRGSVGLTYFNQTADNLIASVPIPNTTIPTRQFQNIARVRNTGVEVEGSLSTGPLVLGVQYGYSRARIASLGGSYTGDLRVNDQSLATPKQTGGATLTVNAGHGFTLNARATYVGSWTNYSYLQQFSCYGGTGPCAASGRDYVATYPSFVKTNLNVTQQLSASTSAFLSVDNIGNNQSYEIYDLNPVFGRITTLGIRFHY